MTSVHESTVEYNAEGLFERLGYQAMRGADVDDAGERAGPASAILETRLRGAIERLNPHLSPDVVAQVIRTVTTPPHPTAENGSAKEVMKSDTLRLMARELTEMVKKMPKLDWPSANRSARRSAAMSAACSLNMVIRRIWPRARRSWCCGRRSWRPREDEVESGNASLISLDTTTY